jgi:hypothetical protein
MDSCFRRNDTTPSLSFPRLCFGFCSLAIASNASHGGNPEKSFKSHFKLKEVLGNYSKIGLESKPLIDKEVFIINW